MITRKEHLDWCKKRALEYVEKGEMEGAYASFVSDMNKHKETKNHPAIKLGMQMMMKGFLITKEAMTEWINGFN